MPLLHLSITATDPEHVAGVLAEIMGGSALPFPPFPDSWIAFSAADDGRAIEVYPVTHVLKPGAQQVTCEVGPGNTEATFAHAALASVLPRERILDLAAGNAWTARICNRGPFDCVEVWLENRLLIEILDEEMQRDYRAGMTAANWARMFGI
ncbi:MAG: hypothetical protein AAFY59_03685 [Pseudomonadota bacterium]